MKTNIKESLQFILQHPAIGSPLVQHAQNLARHVTLEHYSVPTEPQVTDEQIKGMLMLAERIDFAKGSEPLLISTEAARVIRALLSAPPAAETPDPLLRAMLDDGIIAAPQETKPVAADVTEKLAATPDALLVQLEKCLKQYGEIHLHYDDGDGSFGVVVMNDSTWDNEFRFAVAAASENAITITPSTSLLPRECKRCFIKCRSCPLVKLAAAPQEQAPVFASEAPSEIWLLIGDNGVIDFTDRWDVAKHHPNAFSYRQEQAPADKDAIRNAALEEAVTK